MIAQVKLLTLPTRGQHKIIGSCYRPTEQPNRHGLEFRQCNSHKPHLALHKLETVVRHFQDKKRKEVKRETDSLSLSKLTTMSLAFLCC